MQMFEAKCGVTFHRLLYLCGTMFTIVLTVPEEYKRYLAERYQTKPDRLSKSVAPQYYEIDIRLDEMVGFATIKCEIGIDVLNATSNINFHHHYDKTLQYKSQLVDENDTIQEYESKYYPDTDIIDLHFEKQLSPGRYILSVSYILLVPYEEEQRGLFQATVLVLSNTNEPVMRQYSLLTINLQSIEARQLFPCWDEPAFKAIFRVNVNYPRKYVFWPNLPSSKFEKDLSKTNWMWTHLDISRPLAAYNVMFILTDLNLLSNSKYTLWSRHIVEDYTKFAGDVIEQVLKSKWYRKIPEKLPIDQLAIPSIQYDVIGKWRSIIYTESLVLYDKEADSSIRKIEIARTIARAMVRQSLDNTFGLVWWSDLWLNEGLASLLHIEILNETYPNWRLLDLLTVQMRHEALRLDRQSCMKPLTYEIRTPSEIKSLFSFPIYVKAPVILRMLQHVIGDKFEGIIENYFNTYKLKSPTPDDLWAMMDKLKLYDHSIKDIMENWIKHADYPVIRIHRSVGVLSVYQEQYYHNSTGNFLYELYNNWSIPITFTTSKHLDFTNTMSIYWLIPQYSNVLLVDITNDDEWIILNIKQTGYYRVNYDEKSLSLITKYLKSDQYEKIDVLNRAQIIDDTYYFWKRGEFTYDTFVQLTSYLSQETDYVAWYPMFQIFRDISYYIPFRESEPLKTHMRWILKQVIFKLSEQDHTSDLTNWLQQEVTRWACIFDEPGCLTEAADILKNHVENPRHKLSPEWREWTYCQGATVANANVILKMLELSQTKKFKSFNYYSCPKKSRVLLNYLFTEYHACYSNETNRCNHTFITTFVEYAVEHMEHITYYFEFHNVPFLDEIKLFYIIINRLYSENKVRQMGRLVHQYFGGTTANKNLSYTVERRLRQLKYHKHKLMKLLN